MSGISVFLGSAFLPDIGLELPFVLGEQMVVHNAGEVMEAGFENSAIDLMQKVFISTDRIIVGDSNEIDSGVIEIENNPENRKLFDDFMPIWNRIRVVGVEFRIYTASIEMLLGRKSEPQLLFSIFGVWDGRNERWIRSPESMPREFFNVNKSSQI